MNAKETSRRLAKQLEMVRPGKIKKIKKQLTKGTYIVNNVSIAKALLISS